MNLNDIVTQVASSRTGYELASFREAALPMFILTARVLILEKKALGPIEEACLRSVEAGLTDPVDISAFLGLSPNVLNHVIAGLNSSEHINYFRSANDSTASLSLTVKGKVTLTEARVVLPQERIIKITFDPLLKKIVYVPTAALFRPAEVRERGLLEVPLCGSRRPQVEDISLQDIDKVMARHRSAEDGAVELLMLRSIERREMHFSSCVLLYYKSNDGKDVQVGFYKDGAFSPEHEKVFRDLGGVALVGANHVLAPPDVPISQKHDPVIDAIVESVDGESIDIPSERDELISTNPTMRLVRCHEHPKLLNDALTNTKKRLLIVSPWIRDQVVTRKFVGELDALLKKGVQIYIGYGLVDNDVKGKPGTSKIPISKSAEKDLNDLQRRYSNFRFVFVGNTHRKVLISDDNFAVQTSFNWLSFRGDPKEKPRDEAGVLILKPDYIDMVFKDTLSLLEAGYGHEATTH